MVKSVTQQATNNGTLNTANDLASDEGFYVGLVNLILLCYYYYYRYIVDYTLLLLHYYYYYY